MSRPSKDFAIFNYVKAHQLLVARLEREAVLIGETRDGQRRAYAERLRPDKGAAWCQLQVIRFGQLMSWRQGLVYRLSHNGKRWRDSFDLFSMTEQYPVEVAEWDRVLRDMVIEPGELPKARRPTEHHGRLPAKPTCR